MSGDPKEQPPIPDVTGSAGEPQDQAIESPAGKEAPAAKPTHAQPVTSRSSRLPIIWIAGIALIPSACLVGFSAWQAKRVRQESLAQLELSIERLERRIARLQPSAHEGASRSSSAPGVRDYPSLISEANLQFKDGEIQEAAENYAAAIAADKTGKLCDEAHYRLGICHLKLGRVQQAQEQFRVVVSSFPGSPFFARSAVEMAHIMMTNGNYSQARRILYQVIGARDRLTGEERECIEQAYYDIARCYEGEAKAAKASRPSPAMAFGLRPENAERSKR